MSKATWVNTNGTWKRVKNVWVKINGIWKEKVIPMGNIKNVWKEFISYMSDWILKKKDLVEINENLGIIKELHTNENNVVTISSGETSRDFSCTVLDIGNGKKISTLYREDLILSNPYQSSFNEYDTNKKIYCLGYFKYYDYDWVYASCIYEVNIKYGYISPFMQKEIAYYIMHHPNYFDHSVCCKNGKYLFYAFHISDQSPISSNTNRFVDLETKKYVYDPYGIITHKSMPYDDSFINLIVNDSYSYKLYKYPSLALAGWDEHLPEIQHEVLIHDIVGGFDFDIDESEGVIFLYGGKTLEKVALKEFILIASKTNLREVKSVALSLDKKKRRIFVQDGDTIDIYTYNLDLISTVKTQITSYANCIKADESGCVSTSSQYDTDANLIQRVLVK